MEPNGGLPISSRGFLPHMDFISSSARAVVMHSRTHGDGSRANATVRQHRARAKLTRSFSAAAAAACTSASALAAASEAAFSAAVATSAAAVSAAVGIECTRKGSALTPLPLPKALPVIVLPLLLLPMPPELGNAPPGDEVIS